jgi:hypothetical protein
VTMGGGGGGGGRWCMGAGCVTGCVHMWVKARKAACLLVVVLCNLMRVHLLYMAHAACQAGSQTEEGCGVAACSIMLHSCCTPVTAHLLAL